MVLVSRYRHILSNFKFRKLNVNTTFKFWNTGQSSVIRFELSTYYCSNIFGESIYRPACPGFVIHTCKTNLSMDCAINHTSLSHVRVPSQHYREDQACKLSSSSINTVKAFSKHSPPSQEASRIADNKSKQCNLL